MVSFSADVIESKQGAIKIVTFNRPKKKNAIDTNMYIRVAKILNETAYDDDISITVLTGVGDYYSSGNDIVSSARAKASNDKSFLVALKNYITAFITFPKMLIAIVNGPAIGIAATTLPLCDLVFASENSFFYTPFTKLGVVAEGCSSFTFPRLMGDRKAIEMLILNHKMTAEEALESGLVNDLYKPDELQCKVWDKIEELAQLPQTSVLASKKLIRQVTKHELLKANDSEIEELEKIWCQEIPPAIINNGLSKL